MDEFMIFDIIFGSIFFIFALVLFILAFKLGWKYMIQEKRCTAKTTGTVVKYTFASRGSAVNLPVVQYEVAGKKYKVVGPEYKWYYTKTTSSLRNKATEQTYTTDIYAQNFHHSIKNNSMISFTKNPMAQLFPLFSQIDVYYDPDNPKLAYVLRYCNRKFLFWMTLVAGTVVLVAEVSILFFQ